MTGTESAKPMQIGEIAERTGLSLRTLRHYDEVGLLQPSGRSDGGFRLYTESDLERLLVIRRMKPLGFTLEEMHEVMGLVDRRRSSGAAAADTAADADKLDAVIAEARSRRTRLAEHLAMADEFIALLHAEVRP